MFDHDTVKTGLQEDFRFLKGWIKNPSAVGSIKPSSKRLARQMASLLPIETGLPVLELGPGTGVITRQILERGLEPDKLVSIEYDREFVTSLEKEFPDVRIVHGNAFDLRTFEDNLPYKKFCSVISAVPLLNFPMEQRQKLIDLHLKHLVMDGGIFIQMSYGLKPPVRSSPGNFAVEKSDRIFKNLPPAGIWVYRRD